MACVTAYPPKNLRQLRKILNAVDQLNPVIALMLEFESLTGLRYSDAGKTKVGDLFINGQLREEVDVIQQKVFSKRLTAANKRAEALGQATNTKKIIATARDASKVKIYIHDQCKELIEDVMHIQNLDPTKDKSALLFHSSVNKEKPFTAQYINRLLKQVAVQLKLNFPLSTHSFRKKFALMIIKHDGAMHDVRDALGQASLSSTDHYLRTFMSKNKSITKQFKF